MKYGNNRKYGATKGERAAYTLGVMRTLRQLQQQLNEKEAAL